MSEFAESFNGNFINKPCFPPCMEIADPNMELKSHFPELNDVASLEIHPGGFLAYANDISFMPQQQNEFPQQPFIDYSVSFASCFVHATMDCCPTTCLTALPTRLQPAESLLQALPTSVASTEERRESGKKRKAAEDVPVSDCVSGCYSGTLSGRKVGEDDVPTKKSRGKKGKGHGKKTEKLKEVVHVRARRGQATDSHSLAERVRREKINERLKFLQDLVPGCYKAMGMAVMLDEIINYVQSLQKQVEFLSMKLAAASSFYSFNEDVDAVEAVPQLQHPRVGDSHAQGQLQYQRQQKNEAGQGVEDGLLMMMKMMRETYGIGVGGEGCTDFSSMMPI